MSDERKRDTREKIALGGLIIRAGLRNADRAFLLGVLVQASQIAPGTPAHSRLSAIGREAFSTPTRSKELEPPK
ncbi:MAG: conjugal transfer protein TraD [Phyllobacterium sp.]|jgi:Conjugal transfer protein TraD|uniref:conjugal transfer protein TraD n=1 Tax=Phyllobacterium sp. TaxID=1871046 RepID=UPI0030F213E1